MDAWIFELRRKNAKKNTCPCLIIVKASLALRPPDEAVTLFQYNELLSSWSTRCDTIFLFTLLVSPSIYTQLFRAAHCCYVWSWWCVVGNIEIFKLAGVLFIQYLSYRKLDIFVQDKLMDWWNIPYFDLVRNNGVEK